SRPEGPRSSRRATMTRLRSALIAGLLAVLLAVTLAPQALASEGIESFETQTSSTEAGGHPDLRTSFALEHPGAPETAKNVTFTTPQGVFGNPNAITQCSSSDFALDRCPAASQAGVVTIHANYGGDQESLLGTAPIYDLVPAATETANFSFVAPIVGVRVSIPVAVRTTSDYGLSFTVANLNQLTPLQAAELTFWGFPAQNIHDVERFPKGSPGDPAGCPGLADTSCIAEPVSASITVHPLTDNPTTCPGQPLTTSLEVTTYQDPG